MQGLNFIPGPGWLGSPAELPYLLYLTITCYNRKYEQLFCASILVVTRAFDDEFKNCLDLYMARYLIFYVRVDPVVLVQAVLQCKSAVSVVQILVTTFPDSLMRCLKKLKFLL